MNILSANASNFQIRNSEDKIVAQIIDGILKTDNKQIFQSRSLDELSDDRKISKENHNTLIYLPVETYTIDINEKTSQKLKVSMVDQFQSVTLWTWTSKITITVDDKRQLDSINFIPYNKKEFKVEFQSNLKRNSAKNILISGIGQNKPITFSLKNNKIIIETSKMPKPLRIN